MMRPGMIVGGRRWPYSYAHPECWERPLAGVLLDQCDPQAWEGTLAFPGLPTTEQVSAHVGWCQARGLLADRAPVRWSFPEGAVIYWERVDGLRPYMADVAEWERERAAALKEREQDRAAMRRDGAA